MATSDTIGSRLRLLRQRAGISARELDRLACRTEGHVNLIEMSRIASVSAETVADYARVLGASCDWLITGEGRVPSERAIKAAIERARTRLPKTGTG
jgi:transcriptional regulator with XRE-family HTH domain